MTPPLSPEQLLIIADEFCVIHRVRVSDFGALVAAAAVPGARISGIAVHRDVPSAAQALSGAILRLQPLSAQNREFGEVCRELYQRLHL